MTEGTGWGSGWDNQLVSLLIIDVVSGAFSGLFVYSPVPGPGNLVASITAVSGTDPYGNTYDAGIVLYDNAGNPRLVQMFSANPNLEVLNAFGAQIGNISSLRDALFWYEDTGSATQGSIVVSIAGKAGTDAFGNTYPIGVSIFQGEFLGTDYLINSSGAFFYDPSTGALIATITPAGGTDTKGNTYINGVTSYSELVALQVSQLIGGQVNLGIIGSPSLGRIAVFNGISALLGQMTGVQIRSGQQVNTDVQANIAVLNTTGGAGAPGVVISQGSISGTATNRLFQVVGNADVGIMYAWQPGTGFGTEETWHTLGALSGTGSAAATVNMARYRLMSDGTVMVEIDITVGTATAVATWTFANTLPAAYQPAASGTDIRCAMAMNNASGTTARVFVGSASGTNPGAVQIAGLGGNYLGTYSAQVNYSSI